MRNDISRRYGMVLIVNHQGNITGSLQDSTGTMSWVSEAQRHPLTGDIWLGSHSNPYMGLLRSKNVPDELL